MKKLQPKSYNLKATHGFTLIETMIATTIFVVVMLVGVRVLLSANQSHKTTENLRAVMDSMSFVMEDMARNIRLGSAFECPAGGGVPVSCPLPGTPLPSDGTQASGSIGFTAVDGSKVFYVIAPKDPSDLTKGGEVRKSTTGSLTSFEVITPATVAVDLGKSGFSVIGAEALDQKQPYLILRLVGKAKYNNIETPFSLQTSISPRGIDS